MVLPYTQVHSIVIVIVVIVVVVIVIIIVIMKLVSLRSYMFFLLLSEFSALVKSS